MGKTELNSSQKNKKAKAKMYYKNISKREKAKDFGGGGKWKRGQTGWIPGGNQISLDGGGGSTQGRSRAFFTAGMKGFLCTTNMREGQSVIEAYNILNEYAPDPPEINKKKILVKNDEDDDGNSVSILANKEKSDNSKEKVEIDDIATNELSIQVQDKTTNEKPKDSDELDEIDMDEDDIDKALSKEIQGLKSFGSTRRFQSVDTGVKNVLFISTTIEDPKSLAEKIYDDIIAKSQAKCRHLLRFIPIVMTCKPNFEDIKGSLKSILPKYFEGGFKSFKVEYNCRCNSKFEVSRGGIIDIVNEIVTQINPMTFVDLQNPLYTIYIDIVNSIVCLSVLSNFSKYRKYNLVEVAIPRPLSTEKCKDANANQNQTTDKVVTVDETKSTTVTVNQTAKEDLKEETDQTTDQSPDP